MKQTREVLRISWLEHELQRERESRIQLQTRMGGTQSANVRLQRLVQSLRAELAKMKAEQTERAA
jgi:hypothetical protein